jgi:hypothetical protein
VFGLRDRARLDEALQEALSLADDLRHHEAESVLKRALAVIEKEQASSTPRIPHQRGDWHSMLASYHRRFCEQLNVIASGRNARR